MCMMMMGLLGAGVSAMGAIAKGNAEAAAYRRQAQEYRTQAQLDQRQSSAEEIAGQFQQRRMGEKADRTAGAQLVSYAGGGVTPEGSPTDVILDSRREATLDIGAIKYNTDLKADNLMYKARVDAMNAKSADKAADTAKQTAIFGAITPLIGAFSSLGGGF